MKGLIYLIRSPYCTKVYYGSTFQNLNLRFNQHKSVAHKRNISSEILFRLGNCKIELVEEIECENKIQLREREKQYILTNKNLCVNCNVPNRTYKDWIRDHPDYQKKYQKNWNIANINYQKEYQKKYREAKRKINVD